MVDISESQISLNSTTGKKKQNVFTFDSCFDSKDSENENYASQVQVFDSIGNDILENAFKGKNNEILLSS